MLTRTPGATKQILAEEKAYHALKTLGYKILLRNYECPLGEVSMIAKKAGELVFIGINNTPPVKAAEYYVKRYGINEVKYHMESFSIA